MGYKKEKCCLCRVGPFFNRCEGCQLLDSALRRAAIRARTETEEQEAFLRRIRANERNNG